MKSLLLILAILLAGMKGASAQFKIDSAAFYVDSGIVKWIFHSAAVDDEYTIYVNLPSGYDTGKVGYPVLYMTDGDWNETVAMDCFSMLDQDYQTSPPIIVGIGYGTRSNMRGRDLDPSSGGPNFLRFIRDELMPFIRERYRVNGDNALYGYSLGGMFASSVLFDHPGLFNMIFIGAPGNSGRGLLPAARAYFSGHADLKCRVFVGVGAYEVETTGNVNRFGAYLLGRHARGLDLKKVIVANTAHGTALAPVMQAAMKFGYCKTHREIRLPAGLLEKYAGNYRLAAHPELRLRFFVRQGRLYFQQGDQMAMPYAAFGKDRFFSYQNEKGEMIFKREGGRRYVVFDAAGQAEQRIDRID